MDYSGILQLKNYMDMQPKEYEGTLYSKLRDKEQELKLQNILKNKDAEQKQTTQESTQEIQSQVDDFMLSEEALDEMNEISGTNGQDIIKAWTDEETGNMIVSVNGEEKSYTQEEAHNGFNISSGKGDDIIDFSGVDIDVLIDAGKGDNNITLSQGRNIVRTDNGDNTITGDAERANIQTGKGDDNININALTSYIDTGNGNDNVTVGEGTNIINTGKGNDTVKTGNGNNSIDTGKGKDNVTVGNGNNIIDTGKGNDTVNAGKGNNTINTGDGKDKINAGNGANIIESGKGNDSITVGDGKNKIYGGNGKDLINTGDGNNYIEGGRGNDNISVKDGNNVIYGLDGKDTITTGSGNNYIDGGKGNDTINAVGGDNVIFGGLGKDKINTSGENTKVFDDGDGSGINANGASVNLYDSKEKASLGNSIKIKGSSDFKMRVESDLEAFRAMETGSELLRQLDNADHRTTIVELDKNVQNGYASADENKYVKSNGERGDGDDAKISYNPSFSLSQGTNIAPPSNVLFHEGVHAYNDVTGTMQEGQMIRSDGSLVNRCEHQAVGLPITNGVEVTHPDGTTTSENPSLLSENAYRREIGIQERTRY